MKVFGGKAGGLVGPLGRAELRSDPLPGLSLLPVQLGAPHADPAVP